MRRYLLTVAVGLLIGLSGVLIYLLPFGYAWEEDFGLGVLFKIRGQRPAPAEVAVIAISDKTGPQLGYGNDITSWPRAVHARLVDRLVAVGAQTIVMDIDFRMARDSNQDALLAAALRRAGNVILFGYLDQELVSLDSPGSFSSGIAGLHIERLRKPVEILATSAAAVAPFVLPKVPVKVSRFWTFHGANELATMPVAALEQYVLSNSPDLTSLRARLEPEFANLFAPSALKLEGYRSLQVFRDTLRNQSQQTEALLEILESQSEQQISPEASQGLKALLTTYLLPDYPYLNFYGPPPSITTIPYEHFIAGDAKTLELLKDRVVFVGYAEQFQPKQKDGFYTVYSRSSGLDLSGVEIAATAFANLLHRETITPVKPVGVMLVFLLFALLVTLMFRLLPAYANVLAGLAVGVLYFLLTYQLFVHASLWLMWAIPVFWLMPMALLLSLLLKYREAHGQRQQLQTAFGYYLPRQIIDRLTQDASRALKQGETAYGICLATDAEQYTRLSERLSPAELQGILNRYYELLFAPVRARDGMISDVVGDAMLAIWSAPQELTHIRRKACEAALEIKRTLDTTAHIPKMPTRIGLHAGEFMLSHIGAIDHYEYRAVGDIVNTASRIENLNKQLGTTILASQETVLGLEGFVTRELGMFRLKGKQRAVLVHELMSEEDRISPEQMRLIGLFAQALQAHREGNRREAMERFKSILEDFPQDGPSRFYLDLYSDRRQSRELVTE